MSTHSRAVVIVSGGGAVSPYTTPTQACSAEPGFLSAGNTDTALRDHLLAAGWPVFTAPANDEWGPVREPAPDSFGPFKKAPAVLPAIGVTDEVDLSHAVVAREVGDEAMQLLTRIVDIA